MFNDYVEMANRSLRNTFCKYLRHHSRYPLGDLKKKNIQRPETFFLHIVFKVIISNYYQICKTLSMQVHCIVVFKLGLYFSEP